MDSEVDDPIVSIAAHVADCLSASGYAFVEDDKIEDLADALKDFLDGAGIPANVKGRQSIAAPGVATVRGRRADGDR